MATQKNRVEWEFLLNQRELDRGLKRSQRGFKDTSKSSSTLTKSMGSLKSAAIGLGVVLGAREALRWAGDAVQLAVAADEVDARFIAVFGSAEKFRKELETWGDVAGVTKTAAEDLASSFGNLAQTQGLSAQESADFALKVAELAGDLASFKDLDPERVFLALNKGLLTTEREGLKAFDLAITQAEVDTRALVIATEDGRSEVTKADKAYASYEIAVSQAGKAIGDLELTEDSMANQQRQLAASVKELQEAIGQELQPAMEDLVQIGIDLTPVLGGVAKQVTAIISPVADLTSGISAFTGGLPTQAGAIEGFAGILDGLGSVLDRLSFNTGLVDRATGVMTRNMRSSVAVIDSAGASYVESNNAVVNYRRGLNAAAAATDLLGDETSRSDKLVKIFAGDLFKAARAAQAFRRSSGETVGSLFAGGAGSGQARATGGPVSAGTPYLVGERGPEVVVPGQSGTVIPNNKLGGGATINVTVNALDPLAAAEAVKDALDYWTATNG